jgi:hypothetical protein
MQMMWYLSWESIKIVVEKEVGGGARASRLELSAGHQQVLCAR